MFSHISKQRLHRFLFPILVCLACFMMVGKAQGKPTIQWSVPIIRQHVVSGTATLVNISFTSTEDISNAEIRIVPELKRFVFISPFEFKIINAGVTYSTTMVIAVPFGSHHKTLDGTVRLTQDRRTIGQPLPVELQIDESSITGTGLMEGGFIPLGGVEIVRTIEYTTEEGMSLDLNVVAGRVHLLFRSGTTFEQAEGIVRTAGGVIIGAVPRIGLYLSEVPFALERDFIETMRSEELISHVWPAQPNNADSVSSPNELNNPGLAAGAWYLDKINARGAWRIATNSNLADVEVGLVDQNFRDLDQGLPDFGPRLQNFPGEAGGTPYHGTAISAICCAQGDNTFGNIGVNWWTRVRGYTANGATLPTILALLVSEGSNVINISMGVSPPVGCNLAKAIYFNGLFATVTAINASLSNGDKLLVVHSAGNDNCFLSASSLKPSNYLIVGATDIHDQKASYSDFGPLVDLAAPGGSDERSLSWLRYGENSIRMFQGTSFAAPQVTGAASLVMAREPSLSGSQVAQRLKAFARKPAGYPDNFGTGILHVCRALDPIGNSCIEKSNTTYLSFIEGDPGIPGDGTFVSASGGQFPSNFDLSESFSLGDTTDGITVTVFPTGSERAQFVQLDFYKRGEPEFTPCAGGGSTSAFVFQRVTENGVQGLAHYYPQSFLQSVINSINQTTPSCNVTFNNLEVRHLWVQPVGFPGTTSSMITTLDAAALRNGFNFPGTPIP